MTKPDREAVEQGLCLSAEVALAQGFKHTANRRRRHAHAEARAHLAEQARALLRGTRFWFTRLTLVHALCLWSLPDGPHFIELSFKVSADEANDAHVAFRALLKGLDVDAAGDQTPKTPRVLKYFADRLDD